MFMFSGERLKQLRKESGLTQQDIAQKLGINRASYTSWELGRAKPNRANLKRLADLFGVEVTDFEHGYMILSNYLKLNQKNKNTAEQVVEELLKNQIEEEVANKVIPLYPIQVLEEVPLSAGYGESYYNEYSFQTVYSDKEYNYDFASFISGESMEPKYFDGEVALFSDSGFDYDGAVYAISLNGKAYIKRVFKEKDRYRIVSINPKYADMYAYEGDEFKIVGKIVGHFIPIEEVQ